MFDRTHIIYMIVSAIITIVLLVLAGLFVKKEKYQLLIIRSLAIITVGLHFSDLYVQFFQTGTATVASVQLLPIYPCNIMMWLLLIGAFIKNRDHKIAKILLEFTFYAGILCGILGIVLNENYDSNPTLTDWFVLKGLLSHSTMVMGCIYILVARFIKIRVSNCFSIFCGLILFIVDGLIINGLYLVFGLGECNSMYLQSPPFPAAPWFSQWLMGLIGLALAFVITVVYEQIALPPAERWYTRLKNRQQLKGETKNA